MTSVLGVPVQRYLEALELELKQHAGVVPEEALGDAREFLQANHDALMLAEPNLRDDEVYSHFVETYGSPEQIAEEYADSGDPINARFASLAPGWRACCTKCGRSAPASKLGITRIGARSFHKYTLGYCRDCKWIRFIRIVRDAKSTNLTRQLGTSRTADEVRQRMHRPLLTLVAIIAFVVLILLGAKAIVADEPIPRFPQTLPAGWSLQKTSTIPSQQLSQFSNKLGGRLSGLSNTTLVKQGRAIQINTIQCATEQDADAANAKLRQGKANKRLVCRRGKTIYELVARNRDQMQLALTARYELGLQPRRVTYQVQFDAAPLSASDDMHWNRLFNQFLRHERLNSARSSERLSVEASILETAKRFQFDTTLRLRTTGIGSVQSKWKLVPQPTAMTKVGDVTEFRFARLPQRVQVPWVSVTGRITCQTGGVLKTESIDVRRLTSATTVWPAEDTAIRELATTITTGKESDREKMLAILRWVAPGDHVRFGGSVVGSRYGVNKVLEQRFGHCWDFSDLFITLCRASGIPARQVLGWLHESEGHVWAEVHLDGIGWMQVDPTAESICGSDYIPFAVSKDGPTPLLYTSSVQIKVID